jgi:hypothetical protein
MATIIPRGTSETLGDLYHVTFIMEGIPREIPPIFSETFSRYINSRIEKDRRFIGPKLSKS